MKVTLTKQQRITHNLIDMPHEKKKQSTGSWKGKRDKHQGQQKQKKEKKRRNGRYNG